MYLVVYLKLFIIYKVFGCKIFLFIVLVLLRYKFILVGKNVGSKRFFLNRYLSFFVYKMMFYYVCI